MKCEAGAEYVSALCDGETIPREAAEHVGGCEVCRARMETYLAMGAELRCVASLEEPLEMKTGLWKNEHQDWMSWWHKGKKTMRIPRLAFAVMIGLIFLLSGGLVLVRARTGGGGPVLVLTFAMPQSGRTGDCIVTTDGNSKTSECGFATAVPSGMLGLDFRYVSRDGERTELAVKTKYVGNTDTFGIVDDFKDVPESRIWIEPGEKQRVSVPGLGEIELTGEYLDHMPTLRYAPKETLDPKKNEFRVVAPVLIRGKEVLLNLNGSDSIGSGNSEAALMIYFPGEGRYLISTVPFEGSVEGNVELSQIKFTLEGQDYLLLTAMPTTRLEHVWVAHDPLYKASEHMQGASDNRATFMVRRLSRLLEPRMQH
jgi:hypothetical protein